MVLEIPNVVVACSLVNSCSLNVTQNAGCAVGLPRQACPDLFGAEAVIHVLESSSPPIL